MSIQIVDSRTVEHHGCRLTFDVRGAGIPVLLIQGVGVHADGWLPQTDELSSKYQCVTFDNRGMGRSQPLGTSFSIEQMADDAVAIMDAMGWASAHVVGHSMGGLIAQHLALSARPRVRSLSLLCTFSRGSDATKLSWRMMSVGLRSRVGPRRARRHAFLEMVMPPTALLSPTERDTLADRLAPLFGHDLADQPPVAMKQLGAMRAYDATPRLGDLEGLPTLILNATHDPIAPPELGRIIAAGIPGSSFLEFEDASHGVPIQHADRINAMLIEHFMNADRQSGTLI